jgi:hypothetical protein
MKTAWNWDTHPSCRRLLSVNQNLSPGVVQHSITDSDCGMSLHCKRHRRKRTIRHCRFQSVFEVSCSKLGDGRMWLRFCWQKKWTCCCSTWKRFSSRYQYWPGFSPCRDWRIPLAVMGHGCVSHAVT